MVQLELKKYIRRLSIKAGHELYIKRMDEVLKLPPADGRDNHGNPILIRRWKVTSGADVYIIKLWHEGKIEHVKLERGLNG